MLASRSNPERFEQQAVDCLQLDRGKLAVPMLGNPCKNRHPWYRPNCRQESRAGFWLDLSYRRTRGHSNDTRHRLALGRDTRRPQVYVNGPSRTCVLQCSYIRKEAGTAEKLNEGQQIYCQIWRDQNSARKARYVRSVESDVSSGGQRREISKDS